MMRSLFANRILELMKKDENIIILTADLGYKMWDEIRFRFPTRFYNVGSAEQLLIDVAIGLRLSGKIPITYSITPFLLYRPFESLRTYVNHEKIGIKLVGSGRDKDYEHDGISHWAEDDEQCLSALKNIKIIKPKDEKELIDIIPNFIYDNSPTYLNLKR